MPLIDELRQRRTEARAAADEILTRAAAEQRDLTTDELTDFQGRSAEQREIDDEIERRMADELREVRAQQTRSGETPKHALGEWLTRAVTGASGAGAAYTPAEYSSFFFDRLAASSVGLRSGFRVIRTSRDSLVVPRWTADTTAAWTAEAGTITSTDANADTVTATPRKLAGLQRITNETLDDSNPALFDVVASGLTRSIALKADLGFFEGSGTSPEIRGLKNVAGIGSVSMGTNGASPTNLDPFADALGTLETANASGKVIVMHPRTWQSLIKIKEISGSTKPVLQDSAGSGGQEVNRSLYGVPVLLSSQLAITETQGTSSDCSSAYVYDPDQVVVVMRDDVRVEVDRSRLFNSDESEIRAITRLDMIVPNPASVVRIVGIRP